MEELKLIIEALSAAGEGTKDLVILYFIKEFGIAIIIAFTILVVLKTILKIINNVLFATRITDVLGIWEFTQHKKDCLLKHLEKNKEKVRKELGIQ